MKIIMDLHKKQFASTNIIRTCSVTVEKKSREWDLTLGLLFENACNV